MNRGQQRGRGGRGRGRGGRGAPRGGNRGDQRDGHEEAERGGPNQGNRGNNRGRGNRRRVGQGVNGNQGNDRDNNGRQRGRSVDRKVAPLGYKRLEELTTLEPHEALHRLAAYKKGLEALLQEREIRFDLMIQLTAALANACSCKTSQATALELVLTLEAGNLLTNHLPKYVRDWSQMIALKATYKDVIPNLLGIVIVILSTMLSKLPSLFNDVAVIILCIDQSRERCKKAGVHFPEGVMSKLDEFKDFHTTVENQEYQRQDNTGKKQLYDEQEVAPEDDFHDLPIFPLAEELKETHRPFLRKNVVNKGYDDVNHYLDIQFRLLKEDFVAPLRNGISEYRRSVQEKEGRQHIRLQDVYVYHNVQIIEAKPFDEGIVYSTRFSVEHLKRVNWERSRRLLYGSLVCLSCDEFQTVHFAVVANRKVDELKDGMIDLKFHVDNDTLSTLFTKTFTMAESSAYFEAYRHVLKRIQEIRETSFPLQKYIVSVNPQLGLPAYIRRNPYAIYDLTPVAQKDTPVRATISRPRQWPPLKDFALDPSQFQAFKAALTEELCVIQGPPGTGKTFIGLKIVETLLRNRDIWSPNNNRSPILLICYTNHALDQFLEGVLEFLPEGVVRIGGRSSSEKVKSLNLKELRRTRAKKRQRPKHQYLEVKNIRDEMLRLARKMQAVQKSVRTANLMILKETKLRDVIPFEQYRSLLTEFDNEEAPNLKDGEYIAFWLGAIAGENSAGNTFSDNEDGDDVTLHPDVAPPLVINPNNRSGVRRNPRRRRQDVLEGHQLQEYIARNLRVMDEMDEHEFVAVNDVWNLQLPERWRFYRCCVQKHQQNLQRSLQVAHRVILKEEVLHPFMSREQIESLNVLRRNSLRGQPIALFLEAQAGQRTAPELTRAAGLIQANDIQNERALIEMMHHYMRNDVSVCRIVAPPDILIYIAKAMTQIGPMSRYEAQQVRNVGQLTLSDRWRLYKYWISLYCTQLQQCLEVSRTAILREEKIRSVMTAAQIESLHDETRNENILNLDGGQLLLLWLGAYSGVPLAVVQTVIDNLPQEDGEINVLGEADLENEDRYLEDENDEMNQELENIADYDDDANDGVDIVNRANVGQGWQVAGQEKRNLRKYVRKNLHRTDRMSMKMADRVRNVWELPMEQRWKLYRHWINLHKESMQNTIFPLQDEYEKQAKLLHEARVEEDIEIIKDTSIIALTTTGAAKYHHLLERVQPRIVVVEEAAEVLEAHIVTSLTENCQHLILIGDHQQLRPNPTVYELAQRYHLDISLFERLINNNFPKHRLNLQHRMRPEISHLLKIHDEFYPDLEDHDNVKQYEHVRGIDKDIFFLDHSYAEKAEQDDRSKSNKFEAEFLTGLCRYLLQQEYRPEQITILTAYTGQLWIFKNLMPRSVFGSVRVCPVDRYQGEENDIILLSLVRSNDKGSIGFLKIANRVCVALSRAKIGLYCVGNFSLLSEQNQLWKTITDRLSMKGQLGKKMILRCSNHPTEEAEIQVPKDFKAVPEGGCKRPCETRLDCGHVCPMACHPRDREHVNIKCKKSCTKTICDLNHKCRRLCYQKCDNECKARISKTLPCGHLKEIYCHEGYSTEIQCSEPCVQVLACGHQCQNKCKENCTTVCRKLVKKRFKCGHQGNAECGNKENNCPKLCEKILMCGHKCSGNCGTCHAGRLHAPCTQPCGRTLVCGHECKSTCTEYCPPCEKKCENRCKHSKCIKLCGKLCTACQEECEWQCEHKKCSKPCGEPCTRRPCDEPCRKILRCGHECIGLCGETCPKLCRICNKDEVTEVLFGNEDEEDARFVLLEDCKHIIEVQALDTWMKQTTGDKDETIQLRVCPKCKTPIRRNLRYGNIIKQVRSDVEEIKRNILGDIIAIREKREELLQDLSLEDVGTVRGNRALNDTLMGLAIRDPHTAATSTFTSTVAKNFLINFRSQITRCFTETEMTSLGYKMEIFKKLCEQKKKVNQIDNRKGNLERKENLDQIFEDVFKWLDKLTFITEQNADDWNMESKRISFCTKLMESRLRVSVTRTPQVGEILKKIHLILSNGFRFSDVYQKFVEGQFQELRKYGTGLGVSEEERQMVVKAVGLSAGHWYKCRNGHFYAIGECGGAMQTGRCPECREEIGGHNHQLLSSNRHAPEMDGSRHAAWSEAANLANFDPREFQD